MGQIGKIERPSGIPKALEDEPKVWPHLDLIYEGFWTLNLDRPVAFGLGPIPLTAILSYLELLGITARQQATRIWWFKLIRALDVVYLTLHADEKKKPTKKAK